ncbi:ATP-binding protein [bacterium]|nr:ATP-binding protein [bacterium]
MYRYRTLETFIQKTTKQFPVIMITGPRQVGKTTFLKHMSSENRTYVSLDDPMVRNLAKEDPQLFLQRFQPPLFIDEIQYAPELLPFIKMQVDESQEAGMFWLTGSQQFHLMKGVSESLAGRVGIVNLLGFSLREIHGFAEVSTPFLPDHKTIEEHSKHSHTLSLKEIYYRIWRGSFPAIALNGDIDRDLFYSSYIQTYIQRDLRDLSKVGDEMSFLRFLRAVAARTGQLLNMSDMARDADVSPSTAKHWISILQASGIIYLLEPYHSNVTKRLVKAPKLYFLDTGVCCYLTEWSSPETLEAGAMTGAILETFIICEILKSYWHCGKRAPLYYYRDKDKKEIDLLIVHDGIFHPLEFKKTASPKKDSIRNFNVLGRLKKPVGPGGVICLAETVLPMTENIQIIPVSVI